MPGTGLRKISDKQLQENFWSKVEHTFSRGCWTWTGGLNKGYGYVYYSFDDKRVRHFMAYRVAYQLLKGPIPPGLTLDHLCRNKLCVNPDHLDPCTTQENTRRTRTLFCQENHPYVQGEICLICRKRTIAEWWGRQDAKTKRREYYARYKDKKCQQLVNS